MLLLCVFGFEVCDFKIANFSVCGGVYVVVCVFPVCCALSVLWLLCMRFVQFGWFVVCSVCSVCTYFPVECCVTGVVVDGSVLGVVCLECVFVCCMFGVLCLRVVFMVGNVMWSVKGFLFHVECAV